MTKQEKNMLKHRNEQSERMFNPLKKHLMEKDLLSWAIVEIQEFIKLLEPIVVNDERCYSQSFESLRKNWYEWIHEKLHENDFVNGEPAENTWEKRPKACFWWEVYKLDPQWYFPYYDHHCSSANRKEQILNLLNDCLKVFQKD